LVSFRLEEGESIDCKEREEVVLRLARSTGVWFYGMGRRREEGGGRRKEEGKGGGRGGGTREG
jgi:hypothetical protein